MDEVENFQDGSKKVFHIGMKMVELGGSYNTIDGI
jgi:hypothetical protein